MKIGILGLGVVATDNYLPVLAAMPEVEFLYWNRTREKATRAAAQYGGRSCGSVAELMSHQPDCVFHLTAETVRLELALELLAHRPRRVLFEKPLTARQGQANVREEDFHEGHQLLRQARAAGTETAMIFNYRFFDHTQAARRLIAERGLGAVRTINGHVHYACWSHCIDLIQWLAGPVREVTALAGDRPHEFRSTLAVDLAAAFRTEGQATGVILGTQSMDFGFPLFDLTFALEHGRINLRCLDDRLEVWDHRGGRQEVHAIPRNFSRWDQYKATFARSIQAYIASVRARTAPPIPGVAGLTELQFEAALRRSAALRRPVDLAAEFPIDADLLSPRVSD
ncbi:MAG: Gfo/Idh/MocA family oxidoreductase [Opitutaceae bacterium]|nr:Gfo/Idh/MocA family oxidoreductase [Opitutaceae bacterium]